MFNMELTPRMPLTIIIVMLCPPDVFTISRDNLLTSPNPQHQLGQHKLCPRTTALNLIDINITTSSKPNRDVFPRARLAHSPHHGPHAPLPIGRNLAAPTPPLAMLHTVRDIVDRLDVPDFNHKHHNEPSSPRSVPYHHQLSTSAFRNAYVTLYSVLKRCV